VQFTKRHTSLEELNAVNSLSAGPGGGLLLGRLPKKLVCRPVPAFVVGEYGLDGLSAQRQKSEWE
jgi:hypothetical protein